MAPVPSRLFSGHSFERGARLARAAQRAFGLSDPVLHGRYHLRIPRTPREVRRALAYVLLHARKHWRERHSAPPPDASEEPEVAPPRTWLLAVGWRRRGLVDPTEVPGSWGDQIPPAAITLT